MSEQSQSIFRKDSSFIIGFEALKQQIELSESADKHKQNIKGIDKITAKNKVALNASEAFRNMTDHVISLDELSLRLETDLVAGLSEEQANDKIKIFGTNKLTERRATPWYCMFLKTLFSLFSDLLWVGSLLCFVVYGLTPYDSSNLYLGIVLSGTVFLTACFTFYQESKSSAIMSGFKNMIPPVTIVIRNGKDKEIESSEIVPGDIVMLKAGSKIPADIRIIESNYLKVDNSSLTGESEPQERTIECSNEKAPLETKNLAFFGTSVHQGTGKGIVITTGDKTVIGCIAKLANISETTETTLGKEMNRFVKIICAMAISFGVIFFVAGILIGYGVIMVLINAIGIIVANVPEGILIAVTVSLAITAKKMADKKVLVKNLQAVETLGSSTCICTDKTGTLTENKMTIVALWYDLEAREVINYERREEVENLGYNTKDPTFKMLQYCTTLNNRTQ